MINDPEAIWVQSNQNVNRSMKLIQVILEFGTENECQSRVQQLYEINKYVKTNISRLRLLMISEGCASCEKCPPFSHSTPKSSICTEVVRSSTQMQVQFDSTEVTMLRWLMEDMKATWTVNLKQCERGMRPDMDPKGAELILRDIETILSKVSN